jgi:hypothetical protein
MPAAENISCFPPCAKRLPSPALPLRPGAGAERWLDGEADAAAAWSPVPLVVLPKSVMIESHMGQQKGGFRSHPALSTRGPGRLP